ncbi:hypothetical protein BHE74_00038687 [Ensete ventricosum]|uniref:Uncharacterized protein n=1 Tax=Ensete ventricosum TaxID=4639 RepID=A0A444CKE8_ENSVE|nr:hypothetical protein B296_00021297 [Ensete ventricosum]RWV86349.1 hypothetical protein GW17_00051770 [Ensete ventricosum]RWW54714.1 hypothetical protein BHE74_00038687 [Ensete ventricosum]RZS14374.1 hypothetical protein BHM03_00046055 [Ensete ventricosum]
MSLSRSPPSPLTLVAPFATTAGGNGRRHQLLLPNRSWTNPNLAASTRVGGGASVRCMANQRRVKMVAKQIQRELSDMLLTDKVLQYAVLPEASLGADRYLSSLTTISGVEVSGDLQVYVSVFGDERGREVAIAGLKSKAKYVRSELGRRMKLRLTPEVLAILDRLKEEKLSSEGKDVKQLEPLNSSEQDGDGDMDDEDEGIIYIK